MSIYRAMRFVAILSGLLFVSGVSLLLLAEVLGRVLPAAHAALLLMLAAVLTLGVAFVLALWPVKRGRLTKCVH